MGLLTRTALRPFDARHDGSVMGEGAAALVAGNRGRRRASAVPAVLGELLGSGSGSDGLGLLPVRDDGDGLVRAIEAALADGRHLQPAEVGMIVAHGNGTAELRLLRGTRAGAGVRCRHAARDRASSGPSAICWPPPG